MNIQTLIDAVLGISIFLAGLAKALVVSRTDVRYLLSKPVRLVRTLLAMNVLAPAVALIVGYIFALHPAVIVGVLTLAIAPVGALFPQAMLSLVRPGRDAYAHGLFCTTTAWSVILTPLVVEVST